MVASEIKVLTTVNNVNTAMVFHMLERETVLGLRAWSVLREGVQCVEQITGTFELFHYTNTYTL